MIIKIGKKLIGDGCPAFIIAETKWKFHYVNDTFFDYRILDDSRTSRNLHEKDIVLQHIYKKHSALLHQEYYKLYKELWNIKETLEYRIGDTVMKPLRWSYRKFKTKFIVPLRKDNNKQY